MSLLWRDEVGLHLSPGAVYMVRLRRGVKAVLACEYEQSFDPQPDGQWSNALSVADEQLAKEDWKGAVVRVVLADCWVRYAVVPWVAELSSASERVAHARQLLASAYGDAVSGWDVRLADAPPRCPRVACTMPTELLSAVGELCQRREVRLASLQPQLVASYENWRHGLPTSNAWFVTIGEGTLAAARLSPYGWDRVHSVRIGTDWARDLKRLQTFGRLASAHGEEGKVFVDAPQAWREVAGPAGRDLHWLEAETAASTTLQRLGRVRRLAA